MTRRWRWLGLSLGVALAIYLAAQLPVPVVSDAIALMGATSLAAVVLWHLIGVALDARGWQCLVGARATFWQCFYWRWIGESVNGLLPVAQVGGDIVRAHGLGRETGAKQATSASVVVDVASTAIAQIPFAIFGLVWLADTDFLVLAATVCALGVLWSIRRYLQNALVQHLSRYAAWEAVSTYVTELTSNTWLRASAWHLLAWVSGAGELYLALWLIGEPVSLVSALAIESVLQSARSLAFFVPAGIGVQEGALIGVGAALGVPPHALVAVAVLKRAREVSLGGLGLALWWRRAGRYGATKPSTS